MTDTNKLLIPAVPHFPAGGNEYTSRYQNELNNVIRLYLDRLNGALQSLSAPPTGGQFLSFPHIAASYTGSQYATATDTPTLVAWNTDEGSAGFTLSATEATADITGVYKITYSLQFVNTDNAIHNATVWLRVNGVDVPRSTTVFTIPARKSVGNPSYVCGYSEVVFPISGGDYIQLYWATGKAYSTTGPVDGVYIIAEPAQTSPYAHPSVPSAIGSITFISGTL